jgi:hypothetical protein
MHCDLLTGQVDSAWANCFLARRFALYNQDKITGFSCELGKPIDLEVKHLH